MICTILLAHTNYWAPFNHLWGRELFWKVTDQYLSRRCGIFHFLTSGKKAFGKCTNPAFTYQDIFCPLETAGFFFFSNVEATMIHINLKLSTLEFYSILLFLVFGIVQFIIGVGNFVLSLVKAIF